MRAGLVAAALFAGCSASSATTPATEPRTRRSPSPHPLRPIRSSSPAHAPLMHKGFGAAVWAFFAAHPKR